MFLKTFRSSSIMLLLIGLCTLTWQVTAESTVPILNHHLKEGEALLQVLNRRGGGRYLVIGEGYAAYPPYGGLQAPAIGGSWHFGPVDLIPSKRENRDASEGSTDGVTLGTGGAYPTAALPAIRMVRLDDAGRVVGETRTSATGPVYFRRAIVGADGSLYVLGYTPARDFQTVKPIFPELSQGPSNPWEPLGFILKTTAGGTAIERASLLGGTRVTVPTGTVFSSGQLGTNPYDITLDITGNVYVTGSTSHVDFPVSEHAAKRDPKFETPKKSAEGFLLKLDAGLNRVIYSTFFGTDEHVQPYCDDPFSTTGLAVRVGTNNQAVVYATTNGKDMPSTAGAYEQLDPPGYVVCSPYASTSHRPTFRQPSVTLLQFDSNGSKVLGAARIGRGYGLATYGGPLQQTRDGSFLAVLNDTPTRQGRALDLVKLDANLSTALARASLDTSKETVSIGGLGVQNDGTIWASGSVLPGTSPLSDDFLGVAATTKLGSDFLLQMDPFQLKTQRRWMLPTGMTNAGLQAGEFDIRAFSFTGLETVLPASGEWGSAVLGVANAAGWTIQPTVSPYEFLSLYGVGLSTGASSGTTFDRNGNLPTTHNGTSVLINGIPCPLLYVGDSQINLVAPGSFGSVQAGDLVEVTLVVEGAATQRIPLTVSVSNPSVFAHRADSEFVDSGTFNQDGSPNTAATPTAAGDYITLYMNGAGAPSTMIPAGKRIDTAQAWDGLDVKLVYPRLVDEDSDSPRVVYEELRDWQLSYFGAAPGLAAGTLQVNIRTHDSDFGVGYENVIQRSVYLEFTDSRAATPKVVALIPVRIWFEP